jgi:hypothetical protein
MAGFCKYLAGFCKYLATSCSLGQDYEDHKMKRNKLIIYFKALKEYVEDYMNILLKSIAKTCPKKAKILYEKK